MGISVACTFSTKLNEYRIYTEDEVQDLIKQLLQADLVVGYNHISFDYEVLMAHTVMDLKDQIRSLDLMIDLEKVLGHRIKLDAVASATLGGLSKTADGLDAIRWWQQGEILKIAEYCCFDVKVTKCVHEFGMKHGYVNYLDRTKRMQQAKVKW
jgi:DEAD/DEAH box helicase domain-containing protein